MKLSITDPYYNEKNAILNALHQVADPELGINIVDLGLVYDVEVTENKEIRVVMTLSSPSCPLGNMITAHVNVAVEQEMPGYRSNVTLVWEPRWNAEMVSDAGKEMLGW